MYPLLFYLNSPFKTRFWKLKMCNNLLKHSLPFIWWRESKTSFKSFDLSRILYPMLSGKPHRLHVLWTICNQTNNLLFHSFMGLNVSYLASDIFYLFVGIFYFFFSKTSYKTFLIFQSTLKNKTADFRRTIHFKIDGSKWSKIYYS